MNSSYVWIASLIAAIILFQVVSIPALILKKNDLADVLWGPAFPLSALAAAAFGNIDIRSKILLVMISIWALRLFFHMALRNLSHRTEDIRYNNWRKKWGKTAVWRSYLQVFVLQAFILYVFLTPVLLSLSSDSEPLGPLAHIGIFVWLVGFGFEAVADEQLRKFKRKSENKGKLMTVGVWSWSRHPNYFGEVTQWWGIWLVVSELPLAWITLLSPMGVTFLILRVSGVSMLENLMKDRPDFENYAKKTSRFFPLPPKKT